MIVDPFSTGVNFFEDIIIRGYHPIGVWSKRDQQLFDNMFVARNAVEQLYEGRADFIAEQDDYKETCELGKSMNPKFILPGSDFGIELAARLATDLGLPGNHYERIPVLTNKFLMQKSLIEHGLRGIRGKLVHNLEEAIGFYREQGFTGAVLKPYRGNSSIAVRICESEEQLKEAYDEVFETANYMCGDEQAMLLQECIYGTEYIVNSVSCDGNHKLTSIWKYSKKKVEGGGMVYNYTESLSRLETGCSSLVSYAFDVLDALGVKNGNVHGEFMIDKDGPVLIELNARVMGGEMPADYVDRIFGHHETDLALDAYLYPQNFMDHINDPYRPLAKGLKKYLISAKEMDIFSTPVFDIAKRLNSFCEAHTGFFLSDQMPRTVDLTTSPGVILLANEDEARLYRDREFLERVEQSYFNMFFVGKKAVAADMPADLPTLTDLLQETGISGSILILSNETEQVEGMTVTTTDEIRSISGGFQYGIFDLVFEPDEDYRSISESFFELTDKIRRGGAVLVPERTYWHLPCGRESIEILYEAAGLTIEAPRSSKQRYICASRVIGGVSV